MEINQLLTLADAEEEIRYKELEDLEAYRKGTAEAPDLVRFGYVVKADASETMEFVASDESDDRYEDNIMAKGWNLKNYRANPVFLFAHDNHIPPVGKVVKIGTEGTQLLASVEWDMDDPLGSMLQNKYAKKFMRAVSVGFRPLEFEFKSEGSGIKFLKQELLELSAVPVPAHPNALKKAWGESTEVIPQITNTNVGPDELRAMVEQVHGEFIKKQGGADEEFQRRLEAVEEILQGKPLKEVEDDLPKELIESFEDLFANFATKE